MSHVNMNGKAFLRPGVKNPDGSFEAVFTPAIAANPTQTLRDEAALCVFQQIIKDNGMSDVFSQTENFTGIVSKGVAKLAYQFADDLLRERYESQCIKETGIDLNDLVKKK